MMKIRSLLPHTMLILSLSLGIFPGSAGVSHAEESAGDPGRAPSAATETEADTGAATEAASDGASPAPEASAAVQPTKKKNPKDKFRKSKLTRDESEGLADKRFLQLNAGEDKTVDIDFITKTDLLTIGNPSVVAATIVNIGDKQQLVLKPIKAGETTLTARDEDGFIRLILKARVTGTNLFRMASEIRDLLRDIEGLIVRVVGPKVVVEGEILVPADYARLLTVIQDKAYAGNVINLTTLSNVALQFLAKKIQSDINAFSPNVKTRVVNGFIFLEGSVDNRDQADRAQRVAYLYIPDPRPGSALEREDPTVQKFTPARPIIQNFIIINPPPPKRLDKLVSVKVHFVELKKEYQKIFGFRWQPSFDEKSPQIDINDGKASGTSFTAIINNLFPKLESAQNAGFARILKTGTVLVRSGQPANLKEQTEFSYNLVAPTGLVTAAKEGVGLSVGVTPQILGQSEDIELDLNMSQRNLVGRAPAAGAPPITATHEVQTKLYIKSGESAAVAGVTSGTVGTDFNKDAPGQETKDPLFKLIHSKSYRKERSQFVIFVTPQIVENASEGMDEMKKNFRVKVK